MGRGLSVDPARYTPPSLDIMVKVVASLAGFLSREPDNFYRPG